MNRRTKWLVGMTAAAFTFASLVAIAGTAHFGHKGKDSNCCSHHHGCNRGEDVSKNNPDIHEGNKPMQADSTKSVQ